VEEVARWVGGSAETIEGFLEYQLVNERETLPERVIAALQASVGDLTSVTQSWPPAACRPIHMSADYTQFMACIALVGAAWGKVPALDQFTGGPSVPYACQADST
jgi:hypothetical protein